MMPAALLVLICYALGSVLGGRLLGRWRGVDLRRSGSGNIGATNALRTQGAAFALAVLVIDIGKGVLAVQLAGWSGLAAPAWLPFACGAAAVAGHCWPLWHGLDGGKGVATVAGVFAALLPGVFLVLLASFVFVVLLTGAVSLATLAAVAMALLQVVCIGEHGAFSPAGAFTATMAALLVFKHRSNLQRLAAGTEPRFEKARVLGRALGLK